MNLIAQTIPVDINSHNNIIDADTTMHNDCGVGGGKEVIFTFSSENQVCWWFPRWEQLLLLIPRNLRLFYIISRTRIFFFVTIHSGFVLFQYFLPYGNIIRIIIMHCTIMAPFATTPIQSISKRTVLPRNGLLNTFRWTSATDGRRVKFWEKPTPYFKQYVRVALYTTSHNPKGALAARDETLCTPRRSPKQDLSTGLALAWGLVDTSRLILLLLCLEIEATAVHTSVRTNDQNISLAAMFYFHVGTAAAWVALSFSHQHYCTLLQRITYYYKTGCRSSIFCISFSLMSLCFSFLLFPPSNIRRAC